MGSGEKSDAADVLKQGMIGVHQRVVSIMMWRRRHDLVNRWEGAPLLYVRPDLDGYGTFDFDHVAYFIDEGYRAMKDTLESL